MQTACCGCFRLFLINGTAREAASIFLTPLANDRTKRSQDRESASKAPVITAAWGNTMKKLLLAGVSLAAFAVTGAAHAGDTLPPMNKSWCDPYKNYACLDSYLGTDFVTRFVNYYRLEWGKDAAPADPKAAPSRRAYWPDTPESVPPMPFTEWPYGGPPPTRGR